MRLSKETKIKLHTNEAVAVAKMCYAASKLWNVCNYERRNHKALGFESFPDWYYQKAAHKGDVWYKSLPSQTAQEVCKTLDKSWKSFFALLKCGGQNPRPPCFKHENIPITYMQNGIVQMNNGKVRLSISRQLKEHIFASCGFHVEYIYLDNVVFQSMDNIKQIKLYPPDKKGVCRTIIVYEVDAPDVFPDNGKYLSVDLGINNPFTCYDSANGHSFILGHRFNAIAQYYNKTIARYSGISASEQTALGVRYPKPSSRVLRLYRRKNNSLKDYLHKCTRYIVNYCVENDIRTLVIGDIAGVRNGKNLGHKTNQRFHSFPYDQVYQMLEYKCALCGIGFAKVSEAYSSQCSPFSPMVDKAYADNKNRVKRGLFKYGSAVWNADSVGAYNILRIYLRMQGLLFADSARCAALSSPTYIKVAV